MPDRSNRILVLLLALILAALVTIAGIVLSSQDDTTDVVAVAPTTEPTVVDTGDAIDPTPEPTTDPAEESLDPDESGDVSGDVVDLPWEEWRGTYSMVVGEVANIPVPSEEFVTQLNLTSDGFSINKEWWLVGTAPPGPEGCRDSARPDPFQPVAYDILAITEGWYACIDVDRFGRFGEMWLIDVDPAGAIIAEVVIWNFAPPAG